MSSQAFQRRRGTTAQHVSFTGLSGELTVDTTKHTVVVHDGSTAGGFPLAKERIEPTYTASSVTLDPGYQDVLVDTTAGPVTLTLPASPVIGDILTFVDARGTWATYNFTLARNGNAIESVAQDLVCDMAWAKFSVIWTGTTWAISQNKPAWRA